mgnify:CR=1 FL=1
MCVKSINTLQYSNDAALAGASFSHIGLVKNAFSLDYVQTVAPLYKMFGVSQPLYKGIDSFVLGQSTLRKDTDDSAVLFLAQPVHCIGRLAKIACSVAGRGG